MSPIDRIRGYQAELAAWRQDFHAHPETGFEEHRTSALVAERLRQWGIEVHRGIGAPAWSACCRAAATAPSGCAPTWMRSHAGGERLRPASTNPGQMHACGHDGHTTMLLGAARYLAETRNFDGTVHFIFQPAEEGQGGARAMVADGLFERFPCDAVYGLHNRPGMPVGQYGIRAGRDDGRRRLLRPAHPRQGRPWRAAGERRRSGGLRRRHRRGLQSIVGRNVAPNDTGVVSVTGFMPATPTT